MPTSSPPLLIPPSKSLQNDFNTLYPTFVHSYRPRRFSKKEKKIQPLDTPPLIAAVFREGVLAITLSSANHRLALPLALEGR